MIFSVILLMLLTKLMGLYPEGEEWSLFDFGVRMRLDIFKAEEK